MADLTTRSKFKAAYGISGGTKDKQIDILVTVASRWIEKKCGRTFNETAYTELFSPGLGDPRVERDQRILRVDNPPIISVTSVHDDSERTFGASTEVDSSDYWNDDYNIILYHDEGKVYFFRGERTTQAKYQGGYATIPADLEQAANIVTFHLYKLGDKQKQGVASESIGGVTVTFDLKALPEEAQDIINYYTRRLGF